MANEFKIKFEYGALGKKAATGRQQAIQASKKQSTGFPSESKRGGGISSNFDKALKENIATTKKLNSALSKAGKDFSKGAKPDKSLKELPSVIKRLDGSTSLLNKTNQVLAQETKRVYSGMGKLTNELKKSGGGGGGKGGGGGAGKGLGAAGLGGIGASIPVLGAVIGLAGFALSKINDVGNAYIDLTSEQIGNVGIGGYRGGKDGFTGTELGAGMKAYGIATGQFVGGVADTPGLKRARDIGTIFGSSAEEVYQNAGAFSRAGVNYQQAAAIGAGGGIQSELQILLTGMGDIMTESVRNGVDTSNLSDDMATNLAGIVQATPGKSVEAALNVVKSFESTKNALAAGQMNSAENLMASRASEQLMMEKLSDPKYVQSLVEKEIIGATEAQKISGMGAGAKYTDLQRQLGAGTAAYMQRQFSAEVDPSVLQKRMFQDLDAQFKGDKAALFNFMQSTGFSGTQSQWQAALKASRGGATAQDLATKGNPIIDQMSAEASRSAAYIGKERTIARQNLVNKYGGEFADTSLKMEKVLMNAVDKAGPTVTKGVDWIGNAIVDPSKAMSDAMSYATGALGDFTNALKDSAKSVADNLNPLTKLKNKKIEKNMEKLNKPGVVVKTPDYMIHMGK